MSPSHTSARKQSSLLSKHKNTTLKGGVFVLTLVCGQGESDSRPLIGNQMFYH